MGYKIKVTPLASEDLDEIVTYIAQKLENPAAAVLFLDEVDEAGKTVYILRFFYGAQDYEELI